LWHFEHALKLPSDFAHFAHFFLNPDITLQTPTVKIKSTLQHQIIKSTLQNCQLREPSSNCVQSLLRNQATNDRNAVLPV